MLAYFKTKFNTVQHLSPWNIIIWFHHLQITDSKVFLSEKAFFFCASFLTVSSSKIKLRLQPIRHYTKVKTATLTSKQSVLPSARRYGSVKFSVILPKPWFFKNAFSWPDNSELVCFEKVSSICIWAASLKASDKW